MGPPQNMPLLLNFPVSAWTQRRFLQPYSNFTASMTLTAHTGRDPQRKRSVLMAPIAFKIFLQLNCILVH